MRYYDFNGIYRRGEQLDCRNLVIVGGKGNGKTYGALKKGIEIFLGAEGEEKRGYIIRYARRIKESIVSSNLKNLFRPHLALIERLTDGEYNSVVQRGRRFYMAYYDGDKKIKQMQREFCVVNALSTWETDSGADEGEAGICIYDECISRERELVDEFSSIMRWHNNCMRNRSNYYCPLVLLGNTVTRDCTILDQFGIDLWSLGDEAQGKIMQIKNRRGELNCIFEWCGRVEVQTEAKEYYDRFCNEKTRMITDGVFSLGEYKILHPDIVARTSSPGMEFFGITPNFKIKISIQIKKDGNAFGYVVPVQHAEDGYLIINPQTPIPSNLVLNYIPRRLAAVLQRIWMSGNLCFDRPQTGEMYRSFAMSCPGLESCVPD